MYHDHGSYGFVISFHYCRMWDQKLCTIFVRQENRELCALRAKAFHVFGKDPFLAPKMNESISTMQTREPTTFIFRGYKPHVSWFLGSKGRVLRDFLPIPAHSLGEIKFHVHDFQLGWFKHHFGWTCCLLEWLRAIATEWMICGC